MVCANCWLFARVRVYSLKSPAIFSHTAFCFLFGGTRTLSQIKDLVEPVPCIPQRQLGPRCSGPPLDLLKLVLGPGRQQLGTDYQYPQLGRLK